jgi:hypothetical protein
MQGKVEKHEEALRPLFVRLLEAAALAASWDSGHEAILLEFEDGLLRRWGRTDQRNSPYELGRFDAALEYELGRILEPPATPPNYELERPG